MSQTTPKRALIIGGTGGIGGSAAEQLGARGWQSVITGSREQAAGDAVAESIPGTTYFRADMADPGSASRVVEAAVDRLGGLDALVYTAGATAKIPHAQLADVDDAVWERILTQNIVAIWRTILVAEPHLREAGDAAIVVTGALAGADVGGSSIPYAVSKAGLHHMVKLLGPVLAPEVRINAVAPGLVETAWTSDPSWEDIYTFWREKAPLQRVGVPADVAEVIVSLLEWKYVTGRTLIIDGGFSLV
ncbi:SDR family oxidoreductase [Nocardia sp. R7R-8]|uniref:SDR family oxidoreductase n=1 Tax=Nocardia sp. R7R-8 TaxID=3459304 RepID=UPI00403DEE47